MPRVLLNFQHDGNAWTVHSVEADRRTRIGSRTRFYNLSTLDGLRSFVTRCQPEDADARRIRPLCQGVGPGQRVRPPDR